MTNIATGSKNWEEIRCQCVDEKGSDKASGNEVTVKPDKTFVS